jgi:prepilin-type processing-associated H-X9-DG protein
MSYRLLLTLAMALALLAPAWAQPGPPATPQVVAQAFLEAMPTFALDGPGEDTTKALRPLVTRSEDVQELGDGALVAPMFYYFGGATAQAPTALTADRATVPVQGPPLHLALAVVGGQWKIDPLATYAALPARMHDDQQSTPPPDPETAGAGGPPPPAEGPPAPPAILPAPGTVTGTPLDTAKQVLSLLQGWSMMRGSPPAALSPYVAGKVVDHGGPDEWIIVFSLWAQMGAQAIPPPTVAGDHATVVVTTPPRQLVLAQVDGQWKVDLQATYAALPAPLREPFDRERRRAQLAESTGQLRLLVVDAKLYASRHNGRLPDAARWTDDMSGYVYGQELLISPAAPRLECAYAMNAALSGQRLADLANPAQTVLFFESDLGTCNASGGVEAVCKPPRHEGGNLYAFADGHVELRAQAPAFGPPPPPG